MSTSEFEIIRRFFSEATVIRPDVVLGIGDDAAILSIFPGQEIVAVTVPLTVDADLTPDTSPRFLGSRIVALGTSQLAACGASPAWLALSLTLPEADVEWIRDFSAGLSAAACEYGMQLVGGDTTKGPLNLTLHTLGLVPAGKALGLSGAQPGDLIYVTEDYPNTTPVDRKRYPADSAPQKNADMSRPRIAEGLALRGLASACNVLREGLFTALRGIMNASDTDATLYNKEPDANHGADDAMTGQTGEHCLLSPRDGEFELCFTLPPEGRLELETRFARLASPCTCIGTVVEKPGVIGVAVK